MAQQYPPNVVLPETRSASDAAAAAAEAAGICTPDLKSKYVEVGVSKSPQKKHSGNSGKAGRKYRTAMRGHGGGQISNEEKLRREEQSKFSRENQKPKYYR